MNRVFVIERLVEDMDSTGQTWPVYVAERFCLTSAARDEAMAGSRMLTHDDLACVYRAMPEYRARLLPRHPDDMGGPEEYGLLLTKRAAAGILSAEQRRRLEMHLLYELDGAQMGYDYHRLAGLEQPRLAHLAARLMMDRAGEIISALHLYVTGTETHADEVEAGV